MDLSKTMVCPKCGNVVAVTDQFCSKCFERLERPSFWRRLGKWFQSAFKPASRALIIKPGPEAHTVVLKKDVTLQTTDKQNVKHVYHSLDEVPPEFRAAFEKLQAGLKTGSVTQVLLSSIVSKKDTLQPGKILRENFQEFKFKDATGKEQVYHSLDEMPPETRALFEKLRGRLGGSGSW